MAHYEPQLNEGAAEGAEGGTTRFRCPNCGNWIEAPRPTTVALSTAKTFPPDSMVLEAITCTSCGCVSFYDPAATSPPSSRLS